MLLTKRTRLVLLLSLVSLFTARAADYNALDRYIAAADPSYRYQVVRTTASLGSTIYQLDLTSQTWLSAAEVDKPEWHHWVTIIQPAKVTSTTAILFIDGGSNKAAPDTPDAVLMLAAAQAGAVLVQVGEVPNQPLKFAGEDKTRSEDAIIAYTWEKFLTTGDERWPARLPMTKAAVRAMDAAIEVLAKAPANPIAIKNFIVMGASKRGLTTWTTAAADPRVIAIAPMVIDVLNTERSLEHHWRAYGFWAPAIHDYVEAGVVNWFGTPQLTALMDIEDPFSYRERLTMPKYLINSSGDQFFLPDSSQFYFNDLPGEKYLRYIPNTDHTLPGMEAPLNVIAWTQAILANHPRPRFYWRADRPNGMITLRVLDKPAKVLLWQASNPEARDFRLETIGPAWKSTPVEGENGIYTVTMPAPDRGYTAFFFELTYPGPSDLPLMFTTEVVVTPDVYPFDLPAPASAEAAARSARRR